MMKREKSQAWVELDFPVSEKIDSSTGRRPLPKRQKVPWTEPLATVWSSVPPRSLFSSDDEVVPVQEKPVEEVFIPEIQTGTIDKPESTLKAKAKPKQTKKKAKSKPTVVEVDASTFQTSKPVRTSRAPTSTASSGSKSNNHKDVTKLKKSLRYCHTKALKNDPT